MVSNNDDSSIGDDESLIRRVAAGFVVYDENRQAFRPSTQAFLQDGPDGLVSVYLSAETSPEEVFDEGPERYLASVTVGVLRELGLGVVRDPATGGLGHCETTGRKTKGKLNRIVQQAEWVEGYGPE